jgi:hypothetical protein
MSLLNNILVFGLVNAIAVIILQYFIDSLYKKKNELKIYTRDNFKLFVIVLVVTMIAFKLLHMNDKSVSNDMEVQYGEPDF